MVNDILTTKCSEDKREKFTAKEKGNDLGLLCCRSPLLS
jgi:hypothetical protein